MEFLLSRTEPDGDCLLWTGTVDEKGYGKVRFKQAQWSAHRAMWTVANGPIPDGLAVCHRCDVPLCVAPAHLFLGTHADNVDDKVAKDRQARGAGHGRTKLTEQQVRAIRADHRTPYSLAKSGEYPVSEYAIYCIRKGKTWGWLT